MINVYNASEEPFHKPMQIDFQTHQHCISISSVLPVDVNGFAKSASRKQNKRQKKKGHGTKFHTP